jgi:hypothetical protein
MNGHIIDYDIIYPTKYALKLTIVNLLKCLRMADDLSSSIFFLSSSDSVVLSVRVEMNDIS